MSTAKLIRWSGLVTVLAGALYALGAILHPIGEDIAAYTSPNWVRAHQIYWVSAILMLFGLVGLYARQVEKAGWLGLVGFVLAFIGTAFVGSIFFMVSTVIPVIAAESPGLFDEAATPTTGAVLVVLLGFGLGYILFGVATMRAGVLPRWSGLFLIIGVALFLISEAAPFGRTLSHMVATVGDVVFGLGLLWMGQTLWSEARGLAK